MREYSKVSPRFWIGSTGKKLKKLGADVQLVALYLMTCPSSNMIGLYHLSLPTLSHETGLSLEGASKGLRRGFEGGFCDYDDMEEVVWVFEMARFQIGEELDPKDKRVMGVSRELEEYRKSRFYKDFHKRYKKAFHLKDMKPLASPFEAPCKPLRSHEQEQEHEQEKEQEKEHEQEIHPVEEMFPPEKIQRKKSDANHPQIIEFFDAGWKALYGVNRTFLKGRDASNFKTILDRTENDLAEAKRIITNFFSDLDPWIAEHKHPLATLISQWDRFKLFTPGASNGKSIYAKPTAAEKGEFPEPERHIPRM